MKQSKQEEEELKKFHAEHWQIDGYCKCGNHIFGFAEVCYRCNTKKIKAETLDQVMEYIKQQVCENKKAR